MKKFLFLLLVSMVAVFISCGGDDGDVNPSCNNKCDTIGATQCSADGKGFDKCTKETDTCNIWKTTVCTGGEACVKVGDIAGCGTDGGGDNNVTNCTSSSDCASNTNGKTECSTGVCSEPASTGCTSNDDCSGDTPICEAGACVADSNTGCLNPCDENESGTTQCDGDTLQTCTLKSDLNCYNWDNTTDCTSEGKVCDDMGVPMCITEIK